MFQEKGKKRTSIGVDEEVLKELTNLKRIYGVTSMNALLKLIVNKVIACEEPKIRERVREVMCSELAGVKAGIPEWISLLAKKFTTTKEMEIAVGFLINTDTDKLTVDTEKCK